MRVIGLSPSLGMETLRLRHNNFLVLLQLLRFSDVTQTEQPNDSTFIYLVRDATHHKQMMWFQLQTLPPF